MATIDYSFYDNNDIYNDGDVEAKILDAYKNKKELNLYEDGIFYLTTDVRSNILNWYPFTKQDEVLEIGCGCGTITGMLCDRCKNVYSVEGSKRRSEITYYRHINNDNLNIFVGNFEKFKINKKFDYVILIGVFEYAKMFFDIEEPFDYFLEKIKELLKPNGKVFLAIENRYGIKYWAGSNEDHLYKPYIGLEGYDDTCIQTFGKNEFIDLIEKHEFCNHKFYYPFPDYKLPTIVYSDKRLPKKDEILNLPIYLYGSKKNFDIGKVMDGLLDNNLFGMFSNSFLVEFGMRDAILADVSYARNLSYRNLEYKTITIESMNKEFIKIGDNEKSRNHLDNLVNIHKKLKKANIRACDVIKKDNKYYMEYIEGKGFGEYILELTKDDKWDFVEDEIDKLVSFYKSISVQKKMLHPAYEGFNKVYKEKTNILKVSVVDGNASNIIRNSDGNYVFIDQEWEGNGDLPTEYLIYFSLGYIFSTNLKLSNHFSMEYFLKKYNINSRKIKLFIEYNNYYFNGENHVVDQFKKNNLDACLKSFDEINDSIYSVLYYDLGDDFNENNKIINTYNKLDGNRYSIKFELPKNVKRVRFDPQIIGNKFICFDNVIVNDKKIDYEEYNIFKINNKNTLILEHPFIVFPYNKRNLVVNIEFREFSLEEVNDFVQCGIGKDEQIQLLTNQNQDLLIKNKELNDNLNELKLKEEMRLINRIKRKLGGKFKV